MGSFDFTCAVSGLPIGAWTKVRFFILQSSPFSDRGNYASGELCWYLRALPVRAAYNDYGTVCDVDPRDAAVQQNWLDGLDLDLLEKGWGDNTCHDVPTRRGMDFNDLRAALSEGRLEVRPELETEEERKAHDARMRKIFRRKPLSRGIPTIRRVEAAVRRSGSFTYTVDAEHVVRGPGGRYTYTPPKEEKDYSPQYDPHAGFGCGERVEGAEAETWRLDASGLGNESHKLIVDKLRRGEVRVRLGGYGSGPEEGLRLAHLARRLRHRYSVMLSPGQYGHTQLVVHPKPGTADGDRLFDFHTRTDRAEKPRSCCLAAAMVREDVWQALFGMTSEYWDKKYKTVKGTLDVYRRLAREAWDAYQKDYTPAALILKEGGEEARFQQMFHRWKEWGHETHNPIGWFTGENPSVSGFGMDTSWKLFADGERTEAEVENFLDVLAQTVLVCGVLRTIRHTWRPVGSNGPQCGEWREHLRYLRKLVRVAERKVRRDEIREAESRGWGRRWQQEQDEKKAKAFGEDARELEAALKRLRDGGQP
jgi:hypothetical protein